jgi:hypothetical protein
MLRESLAARHQDAGGKMSDVQQKATREEIEKRAYQLFEERGCRDGHALEDWIDAERELAELGSIKLSKTAAAGRRQS